MDKIESILYQYDSDDSAMFGPDEQPGVDIQASYNAFEDAMLEALRSAYPTARVSVQTGMHMIRVNNESDHDELPTVEDIAHEVWERFDWVRHIDRTGWSRDKLLTAVGRTADDKEPAAEETTEGAPVAPDQGGTSG